MRQRAAAFAVFLLFGCATPTQSALDAEVKKLCAVDGGIKVYQTVTVSADKFDQWGQVNFFQPDKGEYALGPDYIYRWTKRYYHRGQPALNPREASLARDHVQVIRRDDRHLLGELVVYHRAGGDIPGPWAPSSYTCPADHDSRETLLLRRVFIREAQ